jgi:HK97 family phage major capsid protein
MRSAATIAKSEFAAGEIARLEARLVAHIEALAARIDEQATTIRAQHARIMALERDRATRDQQDVALLETIAASTRGLPFRGPLATCRRRLGAATGAHRRRPQLGQGAGMLAPRPSGPTWGSRDRAAAAPTLALLHVEHLMWTAPFARMVIGMNELPELTATMARQRQARDFARLVVAHGIAAATNLTLDDAILRVPGGAAIAKATAPAGTLTTMPLGGPASTRAFIEVLQRQTALGQLAGALRVPPLRNIAQMPDPVATWVSEGQPIPVASMTAGPGEQTTASKYATMLAFTRELFRDADDAAVSYVERVTLRALRRAEDALFLSDSAAIPGGAPAGLLNGVPATGGGSPLTLGSDLEQLWTAVSDGEPDAPVFVTSRRAAMYLAALNDDGTPMFPALDLVRGGNIHGVPVVLSRSAANLLVLVDAAQLAVTDLGLDVERSENATIQLLDDPTNNSATATPTALVSAYQANAVVLRFIRWVSWLKLADDAAAFIELPIGASPA